MFRYTLLLLLLLTCSRRSSAQEDYVLVAAGTYWVGEKKHVLNPLREIRIESFYIARTELTNAAFEKFILATGYLTDAERLKNAMVFVPGLKEFEWLEDSTAYWRYPNGISRGGIEHKQDHPVTTISYQDIQAYCQWAGVRLPTLDEWEIASRATATTPYFWGEKLENIKKYANIWYGRNHLKADNTDGFLYTSPVGQFSPNPLGLYDIYGNVFEFCDGQPAAGKKNNNNIVHARGGSWWCSKNACNFFNSVDIGRVHKNASFSNQGFRVVKVK